jgi:D-alanyl-lipoteichoic acid acyltransferase DltB (MBOAT superfamily)
MIFTQKEFFALFGIVFVLYWTFRSTRFQNILLLVASYVFYGWVHPWFVLLIGTSTIVDYNVGRALHKFAHRRKLILLISLAFNLGLLGYFKYFNFFISSFDALFLWLGLSLDISTLQIFLPVGVSFYTFQALSYTIDIYRGELEPSDNFIDFALFVSFFPQLVAGPIERAKRFLPQITNSRSWSWDRFTEGWQLVIEGFLYKVMVADSIAVYVNQIYMLEKPPLFLLAVGTLAFSLQIYADFQGYTHLARGFAKMIGFDLVINFNSPYMAISPSDFWRRWHISFSSWIRDYLFIPLGGSRVKYAWMFFLVLSASLGLSGLWHGAAWHFVIWGLYHAVIIFTYHSLGLGGRWQPEGVVMTWTARLVMFALTNIGWLFFRAPSIRWLANAFEAPRLLGSGNAFATALAILGLIALFSIPMLVMRWLKRIEDNNSTLKAFAYSAAVFFILIYSGLGSQDFIYFQF